MYYYEGETFAEVYQKALEKLYYNPEFICSPRGKEIKEDLFVSLKVNNPEMCLIKNKARSTPLQYLSRELVLYYTGKNDVDSFSRASKFWNIIQNPDGTVNSAYGHLIFFKKNIFDGKELSQWDWAINCLKRDKDSRQAIIHYNTPDHQTKNNKDFVCTLYNQFFIREDRLFLQYFMRSQDVIRGITFDFPWGWTLLKTMQLSLLDVYPNLKIGSYIHTCGSFHLYNEHYSLVRDFLEEKTTGDKMPDINIDLIDNPDLHRIYNKKEPVQKDEFLKFLKNNY